MVDAMTKTKTTGFASPAQGYESNAIDLNSLLITHPASTFFFRLETSDMEELRLHKGSVLVVDRSKEAVPHHFVIIKHEGRFLCRLMAMKNGSVMFTDGVNNITPISGDTAIIGVVTSAIQILYHDNTY